MVVDVEFRKQLTSIIVESLVGGCKLTSNSFNHLLSHKPSKECTQGVEHSRTLERKRIKEVGLPLQVLSLIKSVILGNL